MKQKLLFLMLAVLCLTTTYGQESLDSKITESYDSNSSSYNLSNKEEYTYNSNGELIKTEYFSMGALDWELSAKDEYTYDVNGNVTENIYANWNPSTSQWENSYRTTSSYNGNNQVVEQIEYEPDGLSWTLDYKTELSYVANKLDTYNAYNRIGSNWEDSDRGAFVYTSGELTSYTVEEYDGGSWEPSEKNTFTRNGAGRILENILEVEKGSGYEFEDKSNYTLDANGNRLTEIYSVSNDGTTWEPNYKADYTYDTNVLITTYENPFNIDSFFYDLDLEDSPHTHKVLTSIEYTDNSGWEITNRSTYHYSDDPLGVEEFNLADANIYPNPVSDILNIELKNQTKADVSLFDINGRLILKQKLQDLQTPINIETLRVGIYVLKIQTDHGLAIKRILKS